MNDAISNSTFKSGIPLASLQAGEHPVIPYVFVTLSLMVNIVVISVVSLSRQLHEPRHVYWAGISLAVMFYSTDWLTKAFIRSDTDYAACVVYKLTICVSYPSLLEFLSLAGLDRYLAINHYDWYKRKMTNRKAVASMLFALLFNSAVFHSPYLTSFLTLNDCYYDLTHVLCFVGWSVSLGVVNVVLQVKVFVVSKRTIRYYYSARNQSNPVQGIQLKSGARRDDLNSSEPGIIRPESLLRYSNGTERHNHDTQEKGALNSTAVREVQCFPTRRLTMERLDFRAALSFSINVLPFLLCTIPLGLNTIAMCVCSQWNLNCSDDLMLQTDAYLKYSVFTPCIVMPLMYIWSSTEFQRAFKHMFSKIESRANSLNPSFHRRTLNHLN